MELCDLSAVEITRLVKAKKASAVEVLQSCLQRIGQVDGRSGALDAGPLTEADRIKVHAFITRTDDLALQAAIKIDQTIAAGGEAGALAGVPFSVKDIYCTRGVPSTAASRILANFQPPYTATPVNRMTEAGAVMLGKVNLDEFTYGSSTESTAFKPTTRNPWDTSRVPGGSSGGSAAAVAAGEGPLSLGTDTAGSIRQPAAFCGVVGLKPTYGRVSRYGLIAFASSLDCPGPVARDVTDAAAMLQVIAGSDPRDSTAANVLVEDYLAGLEKGVKGLRIGLSLDYFWLTFPNPITGEIVEHKLPEDVSDPVRQAAAALQALGAEIIEDVPMLHNRYAIPAYFVISRVEAASNLHRYDGVKYGYRTGGAVDDLQTLYRRSRAEGFGLQPKLRVLMGMYVSAAQYSEQYYNRALRVRSLIRRDFDEAFNPAGKYRLDALLTPTTPTPAFEIDAVYGDSVLMQYADQLTVAANHAGIPGVSIPGGLSEAGLPVGIQLLGPDFSEGKLLRIGRAFEQATETAEWRKVKPAVLR
ncbi:MAG: Asp-tRNA(Asn)/Glu-tRNA(Gln) amidotransferase subunit GatA [Anaerolinea sp.]|nr:Asp-tRNA(Asn)/Glu-tRNA(Gln) amidotransferase subunit GatA [Anaerolinea sp.]